MTDNNDTITITDEQLSQCLEFLNITETDDPNVAREYLEMVDGQLEAAISLFMDSRNNDAGVDAGAGAGASGVGGGGNEDNNDSAEAEGNGRGGDDDEAEVCMICYENEKTATIIHGDTGHIACCLTCACKLQAMGDNCPVCREPIDSVIQHFF